MKQLWRKRTKSSEFLKTEYKINDIDVSTTNLKLPADFFGGEFVLCCDIYFSRFLQVTSEYELHLQL